MTANKENLYWKSNKDWYFINSKGEFELTNLATERAKQSFEKYNSTK